MTQLLACTRFHDAPAAIGFLERVGFVATLVVPGEVAGTVTHAELRWRDDGVIMLGSTRDDDAPLNDAARCFTVYLAVPTDDAIDTRWEQALRAGAEGTRPPQNEPFGGRGCAVRGPEGITLSVGSYAGE